MHDITLRKEPLENWTAQSIESVVVFTSPDGGTSIVGRGKNAHEARANASMTIRSYEGGKLAHTIYRPSPPRAVPVGACVVGGCVLIGLLFLVACLVEQVWRQL